jgi:hypothetical protein
VTTPTPPPPCTAQPLTKTHAQIQSQSVVVGHQTVNGNGASNQRQGSGGVGGAGGKALQSTQQKSTTSALPTTRATPPPPPPPPPPCQQGSPFSLPSCVFLSLLCQSHVNSSGFDSPVTLFFFSKSCDVTTIQFHQMLATSSVTGKLARVLWVNRVACFFCCN